MSATKEVDRALIEDKLAEAELYKTHGLNSEACKVYNELLDVLDKEKQKKIYEQIKERISFLQELQPGETATSSFEPIKKDEGDAFDNGVGLMEAGFHEEAIEEFQLLLEKGFPAGPVNSKIAECYYQLRNPYEALKYFRESLKDKTLPIPEQLEVLDRIALVCEETGNVPDAIKSLEKIVNLDVDFRNAKIRLEQLTQSAEKVGRFFHLIKEDYISLDDLETAGEAAQQQGKSIENVLMDQYGLEKEWLGASFKEYYHCPFVEYNEDQIGPTPTCIKGVKEHFFRSNMCVPKYDENSILYLVMANPNDQEKFDSVRQALKLADVKYSVALPEDISRIIDQFFGKKRSQESDENIFEELELVTEEVDEEETFETGNVADGVVVKMARKIIEDAYTKKASDIHIESMPGKRGTTIRFRIDGECMHYKTIPYNYKRSLVSRIKIISKLDISERRLPQDGKIKFKTLKGSRIELRVATLPTVGGNEDVVLRILASSGALPLDKIGLHESNFTKMDKILNTPYGLILCVGPTGSGKTTTLHAALKHINKPERKIWTVEDPVEIVQDGLRQVQVENKIGLDFARVLRSFLRADPDVIMVGETRDQETANTVIEASLTGHLVFSTLHTNSAPETVTRLLGMGIDPFNFADSLLGILAQRLVRKLCIFCKEMTPLAHDEIEAIQMAYGDHPVHPLLMETEHLALYQAKGCPKCLTSGYSGRLALHELLVNDDDLRECIEKNDSVTHIREMALRGGMLTLLQDGILKAIDGKTDFKRVRAACIK